MRAAWTSPCAHGRPRARSVCVPLRAARRGRRALPAAHPVPPPGRHGRMAATGTFVVGADVPGGPRPPGRPHARGMDVPVRAWASPCAHGRPRARGVGVPLRAARRGRRALPAGASRSPAGAARAHGGHGGVCGRGRRPWRPASPERPRARGMDVPMRAACAFPARGAPRTSRPTSRRIPLPSAVKPCPPPGRCGHERTAARCAILFSLRGTDERGRVPVRGVHHGTAKRRKPKRPCV